MGEADLRARIANAADEAKGNILPPGALIVGLASLGFGIARWGNQADPSRAVLAPSEILTGLFLLGLSAAWFRRQPSAAVARAFAPLMLAPVFVNNMLFMYFRPFPQDTFGLYLLALGVGLIALTTTWLVVLECAVLAIWLLGFELSGDPFSQWRESALVMATTVSVGACAHLWRASSLERMAELRVEIEERLRAERSATERLRLTYEQYRDLADQAHDLVAEIDEEGVVRFANAAHRSILGLDPEDLVGRSLSEVLPQDSAATRLAGFRRDVASDETVKAEADLVRADGSVCWVEVSIRPFENHLGERRAAVISRDVTERRREQDELRRYRERLEELVAERTAALAASLRELQHHERLASVGTLAAGIAHQINNPVGAILSSAQFALVTEGGSDEREIWRRALVDNVAEAKRCGRIVSNVLRFARNEPTEKALEDLSILAMRVCSQCQADAAGRKAILEFRPSHAPLPVWASVIEIEQALVNLVRNALESRPTHAHVEVFTEQAEGCGRVHVRDDGSGISAQEMPRIFDPFFTTRLDSGGTGLGLSVAHGIAVEHRGTVRVESEPGKGSLLTLEIPLYSEESPA